MPLPKVYADFHNLDDTNRLRLTCAGTKADLDQLGLQLTEGMVLTLYTDDSDDAGNPDALLADGVVQFNAEEQCWVATVDWQALRHASEETAKNGQIVQRHSANLPSVS
jgi:hypothetical protein